MDPGSAHPLICAQVGQLPEHEVAAHLRETGASPGDKVQLRHSNTVNGQFYFRIPPPIAEWVVLVDARPTELAGQVQRVPRRTTETIANLR